MARPTTRLHQGHGNKTPKVKKCFTKGCPHWWSHTTDKCWKAHPDQGPARPEQKKTRNPNVFPFEFLPGELRVMIYKEIAARTAPENNSPSIYKGMFLACRTIKHELEHECKTVMKAWVEDKCAETATTIENVRRQRAVRGLRVCPTVSNPSFNHLRKLTIDLPPKAMYPDFDSDTLLLMPEVQRRRYECVYFRFRFDGREPYKPVIKMLHSLSKLHLDCLTFRIQRVEESDTHRDSMLCLLQQQQVAVLADHIYGNLNDPYRRKAPYQTEKPYRIKTHRFVIDVIGHPNDAAWQEHMNKLLCTKREMWDNDDDLDLLRTLDMNILHFEDIQGEGASFKLLPAVRVMFTRPEMYWRLTIAKTWDPLAKTDKANTQMTWTSTNDANRKPSPYVSEAPGEQFQEYIKDARAGWD